MSDLNAIRANGLAGAIVATASAGVPVIGICGGYQMLGRLIRDPLTVESSEPMVEGLALLPVETVFSHEKRTTRAQARVVARKGPLAGAHGKPIAGYEIHMGRTTGAGEAVPFRSLAGWTARSMSRMARLQATGSSRVPTCMACSRTSRFGAAYWTGSGHSDQCRRRPYWRRPSIPTIAGPTCCAERWTWSGSISSLRNWV